MTALTLEQYKQFNLSEQQISTFEDYIKMLSSLNLTREDRIEDGTGYSCFGGVHLKKIDDKAFMALDDTITFENELLLKYSITVEGKDICQQEFEFKLSSINDVKKFADWYEYEDYLSLYCDTIYTKADSDDGCLYIKLESGEFVKVQGE